MAWGTSCQPVSSRSVWVRGLLLPGGACACRAPHTVLSPCPVSPETCWVQGSSVDHVLSSFSSASDLTWTSSPLILSHCLSPLSPPWPGAQELSASTDACLQRLLALPPHESHGRVQGRVGACTSVCECTGSCLSLFRPATKAPGQWSLPYPSGTWPEH